MERSVAVVFIVMLGVSNIVEMVQAGNEGACDAPIREGEGGPCSSTKDCCPRLKCAFALRVLRSSCDKCPPRAVHGGCDYWAQLEPTPYECPQEKKCFKENRDATEEGLDAFISMIEEEW